MDRCRQIIAALGKGGPAVDQAIPQLADLLSHPRAAHSEILELIASRRSVHPSILDSILPLTRSSNRDVREHAAEVLGAIGVRSVRVISALKMLSADDIDRVREASERALTRLGE